MAAPNDGAAPPSGIALWVAGARPRTLTAAIAPVLIGTAVAGVDGTVIWWRFAAAMVVSLAIQIGTNYSNDYSDGVRDTDGAARVGPLRLVGSGLVPAAAVRKASLLMFGLAAIVGLFLAIAAGWELIVVGLAAILAGWFYTGGSRPYGYAGYGEIFVFVFFGLVATTGSAYVHLEEITGLSLAAAVPPGFLITAILVANNLRDIPTDPATGKRTLAVVVGDPRTRQLYVALVAGAAVVTALIGISRWGAIIAAVVTAVVSVKPIRTVVGGAVGRDLIPVLAATGVITLIHGAVFAVMISVG